MTVKPEDRFDLVIVDAIEKHFPELPQDLGPLAHLWVKAQIWQESRMDPEAVSPAKARGLMQLMPATAEELGVTDPFDPVQNIEGGVTYLGKQYRRLYEIPTDVERLCFALASYNGGRGYVNRALALAREKEDFPAGYKAWRRAGSPPGFWQTWLHAAPLLGHHLCYVVDDGKKRWPDHEQMTDYVARIEARCNYYIDQARARGQRV